MPRGRTRDFIAKLADARTRSSLGPRDHFVLIEVDREVFRYSRGMLVSYENQAAVLDGRERRDDAMTEVPA